VALWPGNLFPTVFGGKGYVFVLILLESFNYFYYTNRRLRHSQFKKSTRSLQNSIKIGFLFGLFVDAFKVGS
jgi:hypothetical protein